VPLDPREAGVEQLARRQLPALEQRQQVDEREVSRVVPSCGQ
jgi:hypothetical protein